MSISVVIPCYNEENTIRIIVEKVDAALKKCSVKFEIIVVDDGSTDKSLTNLSRSKVKYKLIRQENQGKGKAVQIGIRNSRSRYVIVQDADLEYDPSDIYSLYMRAGDCKVVYGSRMLKSKNSLFLGFLYTKPKNYSNTSFCACLFFSILHLILYQKWLTDTLTGYKLYPRKFFSNIQIKTNGFETDHEITGKLIKSSYIIEEYPISYYPRTVSEGKKIGLSDFFVGIKTMFLTKLNLI